MLSSLLPLLLEWKVLESRQPAFLLCLSRLRGRCLEECCRMIPTLQFRETHSWCSHWSIAPVPHSCASHRGPAIVLQISALNLSFTSAPHTCALHLCPMPVSCPCVLCECFMPVPCKTVPHSCGPPLHISPVCQIHVSERSRRPVRMRNILEFSQT